MIFIWITGVETIITEWLQTKVRECGLRLRPRMYGGSVCKHTAQMQLQHVVCGAI